MFLGATYDSIEGHFRKIKKEAFQLREEHEKGAAGGPSSSIPIPKTTRKQKAKPSKNGKAVTGPVLSGRVKKNSGPAKRGKGIKEEVLGDGDEDAVGDTDAEMEMLGSQAGLSADTTSLYTNDDMWSGNFVGDDFDI